MSIAIPPPRPSEIRRAVERWNLVGWKEIAAHLGTSVWSAQKLHKLSRLPVDHPERLERFGPEVPPMPVFGRPTTVTHRRAANKDELDAWFAAAGGVDRTA